MINEPQYELEGDPKEPVNRGEFNDAMQAVGRSFDRVSTKEEVAQLRAEMQQGFQEINQKMDQRFEEVLHHFDAAVESIHQDVAGANKDEISSIQDRVSRIEEHLGIAGG